MKHALQKAFMATPAPVRHLLAPLVNIYAQRSQINRMKLAVRHAAAMAIHQRDPARPFVFVDCGFNNGLVLDHFIQSLPKDADFYGFEVQEDLKPQAAALAAKYPARTIRLEFAAVSDNVGTMEYFPSRDVPWGMFPHIATTTELGREAGAHMDYSKPRVIGSIDFSAWLKDLSESYVAKTGMQPFIAVKMNIEGAEYPVLEKTLNDGHFPLIGALFAEFHNAQFSGPNREIFDRSHTRIMQAIETSAKPYMPWA